VATLTAVTGPDDTRQDTYVTGTLTYDKNGKNEIVTNVGLRIKGEGSFTPFGQKPALKVKFDQFVVGQRFHDLARLTLNNLFEDPSFVAERLAYDVYRAAGVPAPRANSAQVYVNGAFYGVYVNVESEDKQLLGRWFPTDGGNLYEKNGDLDFTTAGAADFQLETNETVADRTDIDALIANVGRATNSATFLQDIGASIDTAAWLKFTAVEGTVNQWDTYAYTCWYPHNFRLYDDPTAKKFFFIPWGHDLSMKPFRDSGKAFVKMFAVAHSGDAANGRISSGILFQRCLGSPACKSAFKDAINQVIPVWEGLGMEAAAMRYYNQIKTQVYADARKRNLGGLITNQQFETGFQSVLTTVRGRAAALRADVAAN
jgi:spore coat protein CotH